MLAPAFKGAIIGNGLYSWQKNQQSIVYFAKDHGLIDTRNWAQLLENCCTGNLSFQNFRQDLSPIFSDGHPAKCDFFNYPNLACKALVEKVVGFTWSGGLNVYNLYSECAGGISQKVRKKYCCNDLHSCTCLAITGLYEGQKIDPGKARKIWLEKIWNF